MLKNEKYVLVITTSGMAQVYSDWRYKSDIDYGIIDKRHNEYITDFVFNGGENHIKIDPRLLEYSKIDKIVIRCSAGKKINSSEHIMKAIFIKDAIDRMLLNVHYTRPTIELSIPYLPYARQDRVCNVGEPFSLKVICDIINNAKFDKVYTFDVHSDVSLALLNNVFNLENTTFVRMSIKDIQKRYGYEKLHLISPDAGAMKKTNKLYDELKDDFFSLVQCSKHRNVSDGKLDNFTIYADDLNKQPCIIVDDICDGGRTFIGIAKELKNKNAGDLFLYTSHGIYSNGFDSLSEYFRNLYTTNSFYYVNKIYHLDGVQLVSYLDEKFKGDRSEF